MAHEPIEQIYNIPIPAYIAWIKAQLGVANAIMNMGMPKVPGIPDIPKMIEDKLRQLVEKFVDELKRMLIAFIIKIAMGAFLKLIHPLNKMIRKINKVLKAIHDALELCKEFLKPIFPLIIVCAVVALVCKIIGILPIFGAGMGAVVSVGIPGNMAGVLGSAAQHMNEVNLKPIPYKVLAIMYLLLGAIAFANLCFAFLNMFQAMQAQMVDDAMESKLEGAGVPGQPAAEPESKSVKASVSGIWVLESGDGMLGSPIGEPPNPESPFTDENGDVWIWESLFAGAGLGNTFASMDNDVGMRVALSSQINKMDDDINNTTDADTINRLKMVKFGMEQELNKMGGTPSESEIVNSGLDRDEIDKMFGLIGDNIISSLLYPDKDVTVGSATRNTGIRKTFYGQDIK